MSAPLALLSATLKSAIASWITAYASHAGPSLSTAARCTSCHRPFVSWQDNRQPIPLAGHPRPASHRPSFNGLYIPADAQEVRRCQVIAIRSGVIALAEPWKLADSTHAE